MSNNICEILLNDSFSSFKISNESLEEYNNKLKELNPNHVNIKNRDIYKLDHRMNPILIDIVRKTGYPNISIVQFNSLLKDYIRITDYDGQESIYIDTHLYRTNTIKDILNSDISDSDKILKIKNVINYNIYSLL